MKVKYLLAMISLLGVLSACEKDNYDAPDGGLYGTIVDQQTGKPVPQPVEGSTGTIIRIMEIGTKATQPVGFYAKQDGTYANTKVFNCDYSVTVTGPFQTVGEYTTTVKGQTKLDIIVVPYVRIEASASAEGEVVTLNYRVDKSDPAYALTEVYAYWDYQRLVDDVSSHYSRKLTNGSGDENGTFTFNLSTDNTYQTNKYKIQANGNKVYFRIGAKTNGYINYSEVMEVKINIGE